MNTIAILSTAIILLFLLSCGRKEYTEEGIRDIVVKTDSILHNPPSMADFDWGSAKAYSYFRAYFDENNQLIFINEDYRYRSRAAAFNRYYYSDGNVIYYLGKQYSDASNKQFTELSVVIDPDGDVILYEKMYKGNRLELTSEESEESVKQAQELAEIVEKRMVAHSD